MNVGRLVVTLLALGTGTFATSACSSSDATLAGADGSADRQGTSEDGGRRADAATRPDHDAGENKDGHAEGDAGSSRDARSTTDATASTDGESSMDAEAGSEDAGSDAADGGPPALFRGMNYMGMEMGYQGPNLPFNEATGPVSGTDYPDYVANPQHYTQNIDYFASKHISVFRLLFSWEGMQSELMGPIPAASTGNYKSYFDAYTGIVAYATSKGIDVVVEPWESGGTQDGSSCGSAGCDTGALYRGQLVGSSAVPIAAFADMWSKMAATFASNPRVSYGLINEPNFMSTMTWWSAAQAAVTAIRAAGATTRIYVPGTGYTGASNWTLASCYGGDTATPARSNAYGWLNANGVGKPISDPLDDLVAEVHTYLDSEQSGDATDITSVTAARDQLSVTVNEAAAHGYRVYLAEIGFLATVTTDDGHPASDAWADFVSYANANSTLIGYTWWAGGYPPWWNDVGANGGGHFSISPTSYPATGAWSGDTVNMTMIEGAF